MNFSNKVDSYSLNYTLLISKGSRSTTITGGYQFYYLK